MKDRHEIEKVLKREPVAVGIAKDGLDALGERVHAQLGEIGHLGEREHLILVSVERLEPTRDTNKVREQHNSSARGETECKMRHQTRRHRHGERHGRCGMSIAYASICLRVRKVQSIYSCSFSSENGSDCFCPILRAACAGESATSAKFSNRKQQNRFKSSRETQIARPITVDKQTKTRSLWQHCAQPLQPCAHV